MAVTISKYCKGATIVAGARDKAKVINKCAIMAAMPTPIRSQIDLVEGITGSNRSIFVPFA